MACFAASRTDLLALPGLFRGLLDAAARDITTPVLVAAAEPIADCGGPDELNARHIAPRVFDLCVAPPPPTSPDPIRKGPAMTLDLTDARPVERAEEILTPEALAFVDALHQRFAGRRDELLDVRSAGGGDTEQGLRNNRYVAVAYTAVRLADAGATANRDLVARLLDEEAERLRGEVSAELFARCHELAKQLVGDLCPTEDLVDFLTLPVWELVQ